MTGDGCKICGKSRWFSWAPFNYNSTHVDKKYFSLNPIADFTEWLLKFWKKPSAKKQNASKKQSLKNGQKKRRKRNHANKISKNPYLDLEAEDDGEEDEDRLDCEDDEEEMDRFLCSDNEQSDENDDNESDFEQPEEEDQAASERFPSSVNEFEDFLPCFNENSLNDDEMEVRTRPFPNIWDKIQTEDEETRLQRVVRRKEREVATYAYAHYGSRYDNVRYPMI